MTRETRATLAAFACRVEAPDGPQSRVREFVASTEQVASDRGILRAAGWRFGRYAANPTFLWAHQRTAPPIGKATGWRVDLDKRELRLRVEFAGADLYPFADTIRRMYDAGLMRAVSVSWDTVRWEDPTPEEAASGARWVSAEQELVECSAVPVGADSGALDVTGRETVTAAVRAGTLTKADAATLRANLSALAYWASVAEAIDAVGAAPPPVAAVPSPAGEERTREESGAALPAPKRTKRTPEEVADDLRSLAIRAGELADELTGEEPDDESEGAEHAAPGLAERTGSGQQPPQAGNAAGEPAGPKAPAAGSVAPGMERLLDLARVRAGS